MARRLYRWTNPDGEVMTSTAGIATFTAMLWAADQEPTPSASWFAVAVALAGLLATAALFCVGWLLIR